jgi:Rrf2 family protein
VRVSAKADYAVRALVALAAADRTMKGDEIAADQRIPFNFLENILSQLRREGMVSSQRGALGGYRLAVPASSITIADVIRAIEGPLADVRGIAPEDLAYTGTMEPLQRVWIALRANVRAVLEVVTLEDVARSDLPAMLDPLIADPDAWVRRTLGRSAT